MRSGEADTESAPLYELGWQPVTLPPAADDGTTVVVLAGDDEQLLRLLGLQAQEAGLRGLVLGPSDGIPTDSAGWAEFWVGKPPVDRVVLVLAMTATPLPRSLVESTGGQSIVAAAGAALCMRATAAVVGLDRSDMPGEVFVVTRGARQVTGTDDVVAGDHGLLHGLAPVLGLEFSATWGGVVDLPAEPLAADVAALLRLVQHGSGEDLAAVRGGEILVGRIRQVQPSPAQDVRLRPDATYLVTGGLGGVGRELLADFVARGARHLLLIGRTARERLGLAAEEYLDGLRRQGVEVRYRSADCDNAIALAQACREADTMPPVRGIVHGAGVVLHRALRDADTQSFSAALRGKFTGGWWLHLVSRDWPLDFFVQLSSVSALWGTEGYGGYAAANGGLDALAAYRVAAGFTGVSVLFGPWAAEGMADAALREDLARIGVGVLSPTLGCASVRAGVLGTAPLLVSCEVDWPLFTAVMAVRRQRALFAEVAGRPRAGIPAATEKASGGAALLALPQRARPVVAREQVGRIVAAVLGHADGHGIGEDTGFLNLGLDSVMMVDLVRGLTERFGVELAISDVFDYPTVVELAGRIVELLGTPAEPSAVAAVSTSAVSTSAVSTSPVSTSPGSTSAVSTAVPRAIAQAAPSAPARQVADAVLGTGRESAAAIAIVGMAGRFSGADSVEELWELLVSGHDGVGPVPADRWDGAALHDTDPLRAGRVVTDQGGFIRDIARFDAAFFGISAREAESLDPQHRLLLESAWHALEDGRIDPKSLKGSRTGVYVGISNSDYAHLLEQGGLNQLDAYYATGTALNAAAGRIAYLFGLTGPAIAVDTACSSSLVALHLAMRALRNGEINCALAAGVNAIVTPVISAVASRAHMLSPEGRCKTFSAGADGYVRAEGCGVLVLKRLHEAQRDGDHVLAVLHGSAINQDGASSGLTAPNGRAQEAVIAAALADADVSGASVSYLEAHGTGTALGDPIEMSAAWSVLGRDRRPGEPLLVGSVKSNIGHCESAAGVASVIKTVLALRHQQLPGNLHCQTLNPHVPWRDMNVRVVDSLTPWRAGNGPRLAGVSGFGFSGTNAHVIVGEAPAAVAPHAGGGPVLIPLSAPDTVGLERLAAAWEQHLPVLADGELAASARTAGAGRAHFPVRRAVLGQTSDELLAALRKPMAPLGPTRAPRIALLFSGQGSQYFGMGGTLYDTEPVFRAVIDECDQIVAPHWGLSLPELLFSGSDKQLVNQTRFTQPALVALELGLAALWESWGVQPSAVLGHSVGEIAAAIHAGVMDLRAGLTLITHRARLMQDTPRGGMLTITASLELVTEWLRDTELDVAAVNGPESIVVAGTPEQIEAFAGRMKAQGVTARALVVSHAFHSRLMEPMLAELEAAIAPLDFGAPGIPIVANVTGRVARPDEYDAGYWSRHVRGPVLFHQGARALRELDIDICLEIGPDLTLGNLLTAAGLAPVGGAVASLRRGGKDRAVLLTAAKSLYELGQDLCWDAVQAAAASSRGSAPRYPFLPTRHWTKVPQGQQLRGTVAPHARDWGVELRSPALSGRAVAFQLSAEFPRSLADHRLYGDTVVVAGAGQVAIALVALASQGRSLTMDDVVWPRALVLPAGDQYDVQVVVTDNDQTTRLSVQSLADRQHSRWEEHLSAKIGTPAPAPRVVPDRAAFIASAQQHFTGEDCYAYMRARGYHLGPSFCWIADIWIRDDEALIRYTEPTVPDDPSTYELHPGLIDSFFQGPVGFEIEDDAVEGPSIAIPFAAGTLSFLSRPDPDAELFGHVVVLAAAELANGRRQVELVDIHVFTDTGDTVFLAQRFRLRKAARAAFERGPRAGSPNAYELAWVAQPEYPAVRAGARTVVVGGDSWQWSTQLCAALRAQGHDVRVESDDTLIDRGVDLVVDARFSAPASETSSADALAAALELTTTLQRVPPAVAYAVLGADSPAAGPMRQTLWGLLATLEAEAPDRRLIRVSLGDGWTPEQLARTLAGALAAGIPETRLALGADRVEVARLTAVTATATPPIWDGSVLVTGGLGALGLSVAQALVRQGAQQVTLMGRSAPDAAAQRVIDELSASGARITVVAEDVTDPAGCARAVAAAGAHAPLRGVFHLAGAVDDHAFEHLDQQAFSKVFAAKARGAETLAEATRHCPLTAFVLFSSVSAVLGSPGQANYAAANGYLDGFAQVLRAAGVPATSVNWGPWVPAAKGGMATSVTSAQRYGVRALTDEEAAPLLELACDPARPTLVALAADFDRFAEALSGSPRARVISGLRTQSRSEPADDIGSNPGRGSGWLRRALRDLAQPARDAALQEAIGELIREVLGEDEIDEDCEFEDMGLDSIMGIDLRNRLAHALDAEVPATAAIEHSTIAAMARFITESRLAGEHAGNKNHDLALR